MEIEIKSQTIMFVAKIFERLFGDDVPVEISATANGAALTVGSGSSAATLPLATARVIEVGEVVAEVGSLIRAVSAFPRREIAIASSGDSRAIVFADGMRLELEREFEKPLRPGDEGVQRGCWRAGDPSPVVHKGGNGYRRGKCAAPSTDTDNRRALRRPIRESAIIEPRNTRNTQKGEA